VRGPSAKAIIASQSAGLLIEATHEVASSFLYGQKHQPMLLPANYRTRLLAYSHIRYARGSVLRLGSLSCDTRARLMKLRVKMRSIPLPNTTPTSLSRFSDGFELVLVSLLILFLELACIRWFPAHVLYLTFFTNVVLLASFLGMSVGCLAASHRRDYLNWTPLLLVVALAAAHAVEFSSSSFMRFVDVGNQVSPQQVYFGTEYYSQDLSRYAIPVEVLCGFFFIVIALAFLGPGQELGRALKRWPNRVQAYTLNIAGSIVGILLFAACSWLETRAFWWFLLVAVGLGYFYFVSPARRLPRRLLGWGGSTAVLLLLVVWLSAFTAVRNTDQNQHQQFWSPYYRIDFKPADLSLSVNLIHHQQMVSRNENFPAYALPHLLNRDAGGPSFADVLIIGAGSGNDVSRALEWGAKHVDAVEIDPVIYRLGRAYHPDHPYQDQRVHIHLDDGRNFLRATDRKYDLIVYALVDSLVLHSGYSNIRLESFLFTRQTFEDVRRHLKPNGIFVIYNYFRQGWLAARLQKGLDEVFGSGNSLVLTLPYRKAIEPEKATFGDFTIFFAGATGDLRNTFARKPDYWLRNDEAPGPGSPNGFQQQPAPEAMPVGEETPERGQSTASPWQHFGLASVLHPEGGLRTATDDWPFLYLRGPMIPTLSLRGMLIMGGLGLLLIFLFLPRNKDGATVLAERRTRAPAFSRALNVQLFFLGAGFMLVETKAVVTMALLFGSTWVVNSVVFLAVLVMILVANLWTLRFKPARLWPYYAGLFVTLALNTFVPLDFFLGMNRSIQVFGSCLLVIAPILFAGIIFAASFRRTNEPDRAFGINIAGAMVGGLAEYSSMLLGFQYVMLVAILFYALSAIGWRRADDSAMDQASAEPVTAEV
jgi:spermidine synthase